MCKRFVDPDRPEMTCWIPKATNTNSEYVISIVFHCNNGCTNAPHCYVMCTFPVVFPYFDDDYARHDSFNKVGHLLLPGHFRIASW